MKRRMRGRIIVALLVLGLAAGAAAKQVAVVATTKDDGRTLTLQKGQELRVKLDANPSTGYGWKVALSPGPVLTQEGDPTYRSDRPPSAAVGARGVEIWRFRAAQSGRRTLRLDTDGHGSEVPPRLAVTPASSSVAPASGGGGEAPKTASTRRAPRPARGRYYWIRSCLCPRDCAKDPGSRSSSPHQRRSAAHGRHQRVRFSVRTAP
jgi:inhibitor of cysteine peptidase